MSNAEEFFELAVESAVIADARLKKVGAARVGRFHGVPISVKDNLDLPGFDSTCGTACRVFKPKSSMSFVIR
jgi:amidase